MSNERKKVLEMLADGKITPADAERLLDRLGEAKRHDVIVTPPPGNGGEHGSGYASGSAGSTNAPLRYLRVVADSRDGHNVNVRVPLQLVKTGIALAAVIPSDTNKELSKHGIDLSQLSGLQGDELLEALRELKVDVDSDDGDKVRIFCE